jgi:predicted nucleic-acid-binding Zn-ribbon protein
MKYKFIILSFLLTSCANYSSNFEKKPGYSASGFAYIEKNTSLSVKSDNFFISHNKLKTGTKIRIINPINKKSLEVIMKKKISYDNFYKALISKSIAEKLDLSLEFPFVEINEIKLNKSFVAKQAVTDIAEKKIANTAPVSKIDINNISKNLNKGVKKLRTYSILVAEFYNLDSAKLLKKKLGLILKDSNYQLIYINQINTKKHELLMGPYNTINKLKNDYIVLNDSNFEDLDIKANE